MVIFRPRPFPCLFQERRTWPLLFNAGFRAKRQSQDAQAEEKICERSDGPRTPKLIRIIRREGEEGAGAQGKRVFDLGRGSPLVS